MDKLDELRRNGCPAEGFTAFPLRCRLWLRGSAEELQSGLHQGRSPFGNRPCQAMHTPATRCLGVLWAGTGIVHAIDSVFLLRPLHLHTAVRQPLDLTG